MGALARMKESKIGQVIGGAFGAFIGMINFEEYDEEQTVEEAVREILKENPKMAEEMNNFIEIDKISEKVLDEKVKKQFDSSKTFGNDAYDGKTDGYNNIENKLNGIEAKVSEKDALEGKSERIKGGKQKTRVDED